MSSRRTLQAGRPYAPPPPQPGLPPDWGWGAGCAGAAAPSPVPQQSAAQDPGETDAFQVSRLRFCAAAVRPTRLALCGTGTSVRFGPVRSGPTRPGVRFAFVKRQGPVAHRNGFLLVSSTCDSQVQTDHIGGVHAARLIA
jgi:hypothetical protein